MFRGEVSFVWATFFLLLIFYPASTQGQCHSPGIYCDFLWQAMGKRETGKPVDQPLGENSRALGFEPPPRRDVREKEVERYQKDVDAE
ncbi:hypothetical protein ACROYT_G019395 [Oculina patagonica]